MLGGNRYINARETINDGKSASDDEQKTNIPLLYTVSGDTLTLYLLDDRDARPRRQDRGRHKDRHGNA